MSNVPFSPELSWRDVQHLVVRTSQFIPTLSGWRRNGAGLEYNPKVGFGLIDSNKMIEAAIQLKNNVGPQLVQKVPTGLVTYSILFCRIFTRIIVKDYQGLQSRIIVHFCKHTINVCVS